jgi:tRNA A37 methylthiotransferase MiaB
MGEVHSCESQAFYVGIRLVTERAFLKVQDGCDYKCTYCTIPLARGFHEIGKCVEKTKTFQIKTSRKLF